MRYFFAWEEFLPCGFEVIRLGFARLSLWSVLHTHHLWVLKVSNLLFELFEIGLSRLWEIGNGCVLMHSWINKTIIGCSASESAFTSLLISPRLGCIAILDLPKGTPHNSIFIIKFINARRDRSTTSCHWTPAMIYGPQDSHSPPLHLHFEGSRSIRCARCLVGSRNLPKKEDSYGWHT